MDKVPRRQRKTPEGNPKALEIVGSVCPCVWTEWQYDLFAMQDSDRPHVSSWTLKIFLGLCHSSFSYQLLNPVTQVSTFLVNSQSTVLPMPHWGAVLTEDRRKSAKGQSSLQHPLSPNHIWLLAGTPGRLKPPQPGWESWERRSLTSVKHSSVKAFLSRGASEHTGRWREKNLPTA